MKGAWYRVRDEGDKITMSLKVIEGNQIHQQKEILVIVNDFDKAVELLVSTGCKKKAYQENRREVWVLDGVEVTIDEWPFLEPFVEVEGASEEKVKLVSEKLGFDYSTALFCDISALYVKKYNVSEEKVTQDTPRITFDISNPFQ